MMQSEAAEVTQLASEAAAWLAHLRTLTHRSCMDLCCSRPLIAFYTALVPRLADLHSSVMAVRIALLNGYRPAEVESALMANWYRVALDFAEFLEERLHRIVLLLRHPSSELVRDNQVEERRAHFMRRCVSDYARESMCLCLWCVCVCICVCLYALLTAPQDTRPS